MEKIVSEKKNSTNTCTSGAEGGGEYWNRLVLEELERVFPEPNHYFCLEQYNTECLKAFINGKSGLKPNQPFPLHIRCTLNANYVHNVNMLAANLRETLHAAYKKVLTLFEAVLTESLQRAGSDSLNVILHGGSVLCELVRVMFTDIIGERARVTELRHTGLGQIEM
jgi:hypothetical protein